ncbi:S26 family signal peptidase [Thermocoleostomius sinensis]|jgi:signal peptidase I|uniref:S26 family signal peptidase n=1 Tax=Thermocoleostomius sinensis A174 TaxID=2016057 RepID=A0A9E9C9B5_9CYAN|nr:S26 family signal peptidase [Thermocoleostomius sinensis]WAL61368.1 S26 family signal peptidase [Thermocoleostomius sinensis A174]
MQLIGIVVIVSLLIGVGATAFLRFCFTITTVCGDSMSPALEDGDRLLTFNLLPHLWLQHGQIVVGELEMLNVSPAINHAFSEYINTSEPGELDLIPSEAELLGQVDVKVEMEPESSKFIKRIAGLSGDTITISLSSLHAFMQAMLKEQGNAEGNVVWQVPDNHCFVRGDSLVCADSLLVGPIPISAITGIVILKLPHASSNSLTQPLL